MSSVTLLALAFPPTNVSLLVLLALAPWLASLRDTDGRGALKSGYLFGFLFFLDQMFWLMPFVGKWTGSLALAAVPWVVSAFLAGFFYMAVGWLIQRCWSLGWSGLIPLVWAGMEGLRAVIPELAFPWGILASPMWPFPFMVQHAAFGTIFAVSAWAVIPSVLLASVVWPPKQGVAAVQPRSALRFVYVFAGILALSAGWYGQPLAATRKVFTVGQPGVNMAFNTPEEERRQLNRVAPALEAAALSQRTDLLVLPEGFAPGGEALPPESPLGPEPTVPVLFGGNRVDGERRYQSAYAWDGNWAWDGRWQVADKTRLVVFGEYVPFRNQLPFLQAFNLPAGDLVASDRLQVLEVNGMKVGALLCFEGLFADLAAQQSAMGAQVLAVMAIDDWYEGTPAHEQLMQASIWRSIESGLPLIRSASRGVSLATDARGNVRVRLPIGEPMAQSVELEVPTRSNSFAGRFGFVWICWVAMFAAALGPLFFGSRTKKGSVPDGQQGTSAGS